MKYFGVIFLAAVMGLSSISCKKEEAKPADNTNNTNNNTNNNNNQNPNVPPGDTTKYAINFVSFDQALTNSAKDGKPVWVFGKAEWCGICQSMKKNNLKDANLVSTIHKYYHPVLIDTEDEKSQYNFADLKNGTQGNLRWKFSQFMSETDKAQMTSLPNQYFILKDGNSFKIKGRGGSFDLGAHRRLMNEMKTF